MAPAAPSDLDLHAVEKEVLTLWKARRLPPSGGVLGPSSGPVVRQFIGGWVQGDFPSLVAQRSVLADVDARYLALVGRRAVGTLRQGDGSTPAGPSTIPALLSALGIWSGGDGRTPWDSASRPAEVQAIIERLAGKGVLVTRDESFRICPTCGTLRSPERIVYEEQEGDTYLVRVPVRFKDLTVNALLWVDAPWKLLGASAVLVNPEFRYVVAGYHRRDDRELVLVSAASLDRLRSWIPESTFEVVEEHPGRDFAGLPYAYPLRHEFPMGGDLAPPAGTILAVADVGESGTGVVPLVPGHGPTDSRIADRLGVAGWPLLSPKGKLDFTLKHKYAGLDLSTTNEFVLRDLAEAGALFARLRVKRGVPYCSLCGTPLLWAPARAWCLEPSRLPPEQRAAFARLLPGEKLPSQTEVAPWPISEAGASDDPGTVSLLECVRCERLERPEGERKCLCGGPRSLVHRKLLPSSSAAFSAWARFDPYPDGDSVHIYVSRRRCAPSLLHHLAGLSGVEGSFSEVSVTVAPTISAPDAMELVAAHGADAVRAAMVVAGIAGSAGGPFPDQCRQEADRLRRWWSVAREVLAHCDPALLASLARPVGEFLGQLEVEDRAILARWERTRVLALSHYDHWAPGLVHKSAIRFLENDLAEYRAITQARVALPGTPPTKQAALRTLVHLLRGLSEVLAPITPFTAEAVHRTFSSGRSCLFEQPMAGLDRSLLNDDLASAWDRWRTVLRSVGRFRRRLGVPASALLPSLVLVLAADDVADRFRAEREVLARLAGTRRVDVGSPREPWTGRQRRMRAVESEIQKAYPTQASQIIHLLQRMPARRGEAAASPEGLSVVIDGYPRQVFPTMVTFVDTLPERVVPVPWTLGEMYLEVPAGLAAGRPPAPILSADAYWLVHRLERRLRAWPRAPGSTPRVAVVTVKDPLASELRSVADAVARYLDLSEFRVVEKSEEPMPRNALTGRTRTGDRWWVHVPGLPAAPIRVKRPRAVGRSKRVVGPAPTAEAEEVDYADERLVAHEEAVRALGQQLDDSVGLPLLGPAKISAAWDRGIHSVDDLRRAPFETVSALPGFGGPVAEVVVRRLGGTVPEKVRRPPPRGAPAVGSRLPPPVRPSGVLLTSATPTGPSPPTVQAIASASEIPPPAPPTTAPPQENEAVIPPPPAEPSSKAESPEAPPSLPAPALAPPAEEPAPGAVPEGAEEAAEGPPETETAEEVASPMVTPATESPAPVPIPPSGENVLLPETPPPTEPPPVEESTTPESAPVSPAPPAPEEAQFVDASLPTEELPAPEEPPPAEVTPVQEEPSVASELVGPLPEEPPSSREASPAAELPLVEPSGEPMLESAPPSEPGPPPPEPIPTEEPPSELPPAGTREPPEVQPTPAPPGDTLSLESAPSPPEAPTNLPEETEAEPREAMAPAPALTEPLPPPAEPEPPIAEGPASEAGPEPEPPPGGSVEVAAELPPPAPTPPPEGPASPEPTPPPVPEATSPEAEPAVPPEATEAAAIAPVSTPAGEAVSPSVEPSVPLPVATAAEPPPGPAAEAVVPPAVLAPPEPEPPLPPSGVELTIADSLVAALGGFLESTAAGHHGVCVVRESPERIRARVGPRPIEVIWLTNIGRGPSLRPSDLDGAWTFLTRKLVDEHVTAFFIEGIEYLVRLHGADAVLTGLVQFDRLARENDARVWVCLVPALMRPADLDRFRATFGGGSS